jgi:hypothetical protein
MLKSMAGMVISKSRKDIKLKDPARLHTGRGLVFFSKQPTASGAHTGTNNNAAGNAGLYHDAAKVKTQMKFPAV